MKKLIPLLCYFFSPKILAATIPLFHMGYIEVNSNALANAQCYRNASNHKPFFNMVTIFAANINGSDPNHPIISFNPQVDDLLNHTQQIASLQQAGIKVLLTLLGNHQNAGWACMTDQNAIEAFAKQVVAVTNYYHLDGIDIDDEYSKCHSEPTSLIRLAQAIKMQPSFKGKLLTKALYGDLQDFKATYQGHKLSDFLDYNWEMSYGNDNFDLRLTPYLEAGVPKEHLALGVSTNLTAKIAIQAINYLQQHADGTIMIYNITRDSGNYLTQLLQAESGDKIEILPNCLQ